MHFPQQYAHPQPVQHRKGKERKKVFVSFQVEFIPFKTHKTEINKSWFFFCFFCSITTTVPNDHIDRIVKPGCDDNQ